MLKQLLIKERCCVRAAIGTLILLCSTSCIAQKAAPRPNIVFILADDLGISDLGSDGRPDMATPNIDQLAADGIRFSEAYANASVCSPTRVGLITGRYQQRQRVGLDEPIAGNPAIGLSTGQPTLPSELKKLGYNTALVGKWHLGSAPQFSPLKHGYDTFWGIRGGGVDYYSHTIVFGDIVRHDLWNGDEEIQREGYLTNLLGDQGSEAIDRLAAKQSPYMLSLHFTAPHWPWEAANQPEAAEAVGQSYHTDGGSMAIYRDMVESLDANIAKVMEGIEASGEAENTIVVFTSDNGGERFSMTWPYNGMKGELLEGGIRAPLIVRWPAQVPAGSQTDQLAISMDWFPTLIKLAGGEPPATDGIDLNAVLKGESSQERSLFWRHKAHDQAAVRAGKYKYLSIGGNEYLFNVQEDPQERANLKARESQVFESMRLSWEAWNKEMLPYPEDSYSADNKYFKNIPERY